MSTSQDKPTSAPRTTRLVYLVTVIAAIGGFLFGYDTGVISGALLFIEKDFTMSPFVEGVVVSAILVGAFFGAMGCGPLADRLGRRLSILVLAAVFGVGSVLAATAVSVPMLVGARVVLGIAVGGASVLVPVYISEAAPPHLRGRLVSVNQLLLTVGILGAYLTNALFDYDGGWRWMFALGTVPAAALAFGLLPLPETPRWLVEKGRRDEALEVLWRLRDERTAERELAEIEQVRQEEEEHEESLRDLLQPWVRPALIAGIGVSVFGQAGGINTVIYYAPKILKGAGLGNSAAILATVGIGAVNVVMTLVGMALVDRAGRRILLMVGFAVMAVCLGVLGVVLGGTVSGGTGAIAIACLVVYIAAFAVSVGVVVFVLPSEIYPLRIRGAAMSATLMCNWAMNFLVALTFLSLLNSLGNSVTFWLYAAVCVLGWLYAVKLVPETKGRSLEEIERWLRSGRRDVSATASGGDGGSGSQR
jgi:sugar porter (SP) family MFS transporter